MQKTKMLIRSENHSNKILPLPRIQTIRIYPKINPRFELNIKESF